MFPLPRVFLFPHQVLPLHVFEPRYRRMVESLLDSAGRMVIGTIPTGAPPELPHAPPPVLPVAGFGEIARHQRLPDGRFHIWVLGLCRVQIEEVASEQPFRLVQCRPFPEVAAPDDDGPQLADDVRHAMTALLKEPLPLPPNAPLALLVDLLLQALRVPAEVVAAVFAEPAVAARARTVLRLARKSPPAA